MIVWKIDQKLAKSLAVIIIGITNNNNYADGEAQKSPTITINN